MHRVLNFLFIVLLVCSSALFAGQPELYRMDPSHSLAGFKVKYFKLVGVEGRFETIQGAFLIDTTDLTKMSFSAILKTESVNTANEGRDEDLKGEDFFNVEKFPAITFQSKSVEKQGDKYIAHGLFTMKGVTKEIDLPISFLGTMVDQRGNVRVGFESKTNLSRSVYGVNGSKMSVEDEVEINLSALCIHQNLDSARLSFGRKKSVAQAMMDAMSEKGLKEALDVYRTVKSANDTSYDMGPNALGVLIMKLADKGKASDAVEIAKIGAESNPEDGQSYFRLGYAYYKANDKGKAKESFAKALQLDPFNASAMELMRQVE